MGEKPMGNAAEFAVKLTEDVVDKNGRAYPPELISNPTGDMAVDTTIAPWAELDPPTSSSYSIATQSSRSFSKSSINFWPLRQPSSVNLVWHGRNSESGPHPVPPNSKRRSTEDVDPMNLVPASHTAHSGELRKSKSSLLSKFKVLGSKVHLPHSSDDSNSSIPPPVPPKPSSEFVFNAPVDPPHPLTGASSVLSLPKEPPPKDRTKPREKREKKVKIKKNSAPTPPPKDGGLSISLDTDLGRMDGIVDFSRSSANLPGHSGSPGSALMSFIDSDSATTTLLNPPTFSDPFASTPSTDSKATVLVPKVSPTTVLPGSDSHRYAQSSSSTASAGAWVPPQSWAVVAENGKTGLEQQESSSSDESVGTGPSQKKKPKSKNKVIEGRLYPASLSTSEQTKTSNRWKEKPSEHEINVRIYRTNGMYHVTIINPSITVVELLPALYRKLEAEQQNLGYRLYLKERGKERALSHDEVPYHIVRHRMEQCGYTWEDGLELLSGENLTFILKFTFKAQELGIGRRSFSSDPHNPTFEDTEFKLESFDYVDLTGRSLRAIPAVLHQHADQIISLKLSRNPMIDLPLDFVQSCTQLRDLRLSNMSMKKVPQSISSAAALHRLDLSCNRLSNLYRANLHMLPELMALHLQNNRLEMVPTWFTHMSALTALNMSNNKFKTIPPEILQMRALRDLDVSFNLLEDLPANISKLKNLERFVFVGNLITRIPDGFFDLVNLRYVDCRRNQINDLNVICNLPRLKILYADHNDVHALDISMGPKLTTVTISFNEITKIILSPGPLGCAPRSLVTLDLSNASLTSFDDSVLCNLNTLHQLKLDHNNLTALPDSLGQLTELELLSCTDNRLIHLPGTLGQLPKLHRLDAHNNNLRDVPDSIWLCKSLTYLNLSSNFVTQWPPPSIIQINRDDPHELPPFYDSEHIILGHAYPPLMFSLHWLSISENKLSSGDALRNIAFLKGLRSLNLSYNEIPELPLRFLREMTKLNHLYLCGNELTNLPIEDIVRLHNINTMFISGNKLQSLPAELNRLENLKIFDASNNNLRYNINNYEFDWNWNFNNELKFLNLSGNKRLVIKSDSRGPGTSRSSKELPFGATSLSGFSSLRQLRNLGLIDVTVAASDMGVDLPDETQDRRIRTTTSVMGGLGYGMSDCLGSEDALTMLDLVHEFPGQTGKAIFAMFGTTNPPKSLPRGVSPNRHAKFLHDNFLDTFLKHLDHSSMRGTVNREKDALRRTFLQLNQELHNSLFTTSHRKMSYASSLAAPKLNVDPVTARGGCSGIVVYISDRKLYAANVGTSLGVISRKNEAFLVSRKHEPYDADELVRIRSCEGWVSPGGLVNDEVDVSRSFGFYQLLPMINASPDIFVWDLTEADEFLILGNRGLWDYVSMQTAVDIARTTNDPMQAAQKLRDFAISYNSTASIMVMVVRLRDIHDKSRVRASHVENILDPSLSMIYPITHIPRQPNNMVTDKSVRRAKPEVPPPTGHIALVFTDIRNSTHLWEVNPGMPAAIQLHNDLMRRRLRHCGGYEFKTEGDAFLCSFPDVLSAVWFCLSVQVQLLQEKWPVEILESQDGEEVVDAKGNLIARGISVRMGIHCGVPLCAQDPVTHRMDYLGPVINRAARVSGMAQGGQVMCSSAVIQEIKAKILESEPETDRSSVQPQAAIEAIKQIGVVIREVGETKLKGLEVPEFLSAIYPMGLETRHELISDASVGTAHTQFNLLHMRKLGYLCLRLEALASGKMFRPINELERRQKMEIEEEKTTKRMGRVEKEAAKRKAKEDLDGWRFDDDKEEDGRYEEDRLILEGDPDILLPPMSNKSSDDDLGLILESFALRIQNSINCIHKRFNPTKIDTARVVDLLGDAGFDASTLILIQQLLN